MSYIFKKLILRNFVTHKETVLDLDKSSILLISGANGTGKTLVLDGFMLAIGGSSERLKEKPLASFIGPFEKKAKVQLVLNNLKIPGENRRMIFVFDPDLNALIDRDTIEIEVEITPKGVREYRINGRKYIGKRKIIKQDILTIFRSINSNSDAPLFATEQGTISTFAKSSSRKKFEVLLKSTNLQYYLDKILEARSLLRQSLQELTPLTNALQEEERKLSMYRAKYENYIQKQKLEEYKKSLETELFWARVANLENLQNSILKEIDKKKHELEHITTRLEELKTVYRQTNSEITQIEDEIKERNAIINDLQSQQMKLEAKKEILQKELEKYENAKSIRQSISADKKRYYELVSKLNQDITTIQNRITQIRNEIKSMERMINEYQSHMGDKDELIEKMSYLERLLFTDALAFKEKLIEAELDEYVIGPIFSMINIKRGFESWELSVRIALRNHFYSFLAVNEHGYVHAKKLYDKWKGKKPNITVIKFFDKTTKFRKPLNNPYVFDYAVNLIEGDSRVVSYLNKVVSDVVAQDTKNPLVLTNAAVSLKTNIITQDGTVQYLREGGFRKPPQPFIAPFGIDITQLKGTTSFYDAREKITKLREKINSYYNEEFVLSRQLAELKKRLLQMEDYSDIDSDDVESKMKYLQDEIFAIDSQISIIKNKISENENILFDFEKKLENLKSKRLSLDNDIFKLSTFYDNTNNELSKLNSQLETVKREINDLLKQSSSFGPRPDELKTIEKIQEEINKVEGMLSVLTASEEDKKRYELQKQRVEEFRKYIRERSKHIENLRKDLEVRINDWINMIHNIISQIREIMINLLKDKFANVRLRVTNAENPEKTELFIEVSEKSNPAFFKGYGHLSGGEEVLVTEAFILSLHVLKGTPLHIIDEITQRLDDANRGLALDMVIRAVKLIQHEKNYIPQFILLTPTTLGLKIPKNVYHVIFLKSHLKGKFYTVLSGAE